MLRLDQVDIRRDGFGLRADLCFTARVTALIGPSGAGKTTLLDLIAGFLEPTSGRVLWDGADITARPPAKRPCAVIFQDNNLFPHLSVAENLALALPGRDGASALIDAALREVDLRGVATRKPATLSGGQQARVALARVLLQERPILLLDEAFGALGPALKAEMLDLVAAKAQERGLHVLMVSHDPRDAARIADETSVVADGMVQAPHDTQDLLASPPAALRAYLGS